MPALIDRGMGWLPDYPDLRDYTARHEQVRKLMPRPARTQQRRTGSAPVDLRELCPPVEDQGELGSCTANAAVAVVEYCERRASGTHTDASRLFLYKATRNLMHMTGDTGAWLRTTMKAMVLFGVPPEEYWPYRVADFDKEPTAFCYAFGQAYQPIKYYRHDPAGTTSEAALEAVKDSLRSGWPCMFGFTVYESIYDVGADGKIPFPGPKEKVAGGHAVAAVGYDDKMEVAKERGALLIRNSWGKAWGDGGYGSLPYAYVLQGLAEDFWSITKQEWVDSGEFG